MNLEDGHAGGYKPKYMEYAACILKIDLEKKLQLLQDPSLGETGTGYRYITR
jgi:hypothetical protein